MLGGFQVKQFMQLFTVEQAPHHSGKSFGGTKQVYLLRNISHIGGGVERLFFLANTGNTVVV